MKRPPTFSSATLRIGEANGKTSFHGVLNASLRTFAEVLLEARLPK